MFRTVAAGFVADELPKNLVEKFIAKINDKYDDVYCGKGGLEDTATTSFKD